MTRYKKAPALSICPFCAALGDQLKVLEFDDGCAVVCHCCGAIGPTDTRRDQAIELWNGGARKALEAA